MSTNAYERERLLRIGKWTMEWQSQETKESTSMFGEFGEQLVTDRKSQPFDPVEKAEHYNVHPSGIECIDVIEHMSFNIGSIIKYIWRAGLKSQETHLQDLKKAKWYLEREIANQERRLKNGG